MSLSETTGMVTISMTIGGVSVVSFSISGPLSSESLGRPGNKACGSSGVSSNSRAVVVSKGSIAVTVSLSGPLASQTLGRSGLEAGGVTVTVGGVTITITESVSRIAVVGISLGVSGPLATTSKTGGGVVGGGDSGPVGVGVVKGGSVVSVSLRGSHGDGQSGESNLKFF